MARRCTDWVLVAVACTGQLGCSSDPIPRTVPVSGKVSCAGSAVHHGTVVYWPDPDKGNTSPFEAAGQIREDGSYELITRGKPGAPPGAYKATVTSVVPTNPKDPYSRTKSLVPREWNARDSTPFDVEVSDSPPVGAYDLGDQKK